MRAVRDAAARTLIAGACALVLASCGDGGGQAARGQSLLPSASDLQQFTCADWQRATPARRGAVLDALRAVTGGQVVGGGVAGRGSVLREDDAFRLFNGHCRHRYAEAFVLYKLYGQAAGFIGVAP